MIQPLYTSGFTGGNPVSPLLIGRWAHHSQSASSPMPAAGTIRNWRIAYQAPPGGSKSVTLKVYKNGSPTSLQVRIQGSQTTAADLTHEVTVAAGDLIDVRYSATGGDSFLWYASAIEWEPDDGVSAVYGYAQAGGASLFSATDTQYDGAFFGGILGASDSTESSYVGSTSGGTVTKHYVNLNDAPGSGKSRAFTVILNGVAQDGSGGTPNTTITISNAATSGSASFSLTIAPGDLVSVRAVPSGSPTATGGSGGIAFEPDTPDQCPIGMDAIALTSNGTSYTHVTGSFPSNDWSASEPPSRLIGSLTATVLSGMSVYLTAAPGSGKSREFTLIKNGSATTQTVTLADSDTVATTGGDPVTIALGDTFSLREVRSGVPTGGTIKVTFYLVGTADAPIVGSAVFGVTTTVTATRAIAFGLNGDVNTHGTAGEFKVFGDCEITGNLEVGGTITGGGLLTGPGSSTDNAIARFDGTGGGTLQGSSVTVEDDGRIAHLTDPSGAQDAATKNYVDGLALNLGTRATVRTATTANITIATALNNGDTLDGVTLATGDLVLVKNQSSAADNGVYIVAVSPARSTQFDAYNEYPGALLAVQEGTTNADTLWLCTSNAGGTIGVTSITFSAVSTSGGTGDVVGPSSSVDGEGVIFDGTTGKLLKRATGTGFVRYAAGVESVSKLKRVVGMMIGDGANVITTGVAGFVSCPVAGTITKVRLLSSDAAVTSGSIVVDIWKDTYANYPPVVGDSITASAKPTISSTTKSEDSTLTGWTTSVSAGDVLGFNVDSVASLKRVTVELTVDE